MFFKTLCQFFLRARPLTLPRREKENTSIRFKSKSFFVFLLAVIADVVVFLGTAFV